jgi:hypothetical protein
MASQKLTNMRRGWLVRAAFILKERATDFRGSARIVESLESAFRRFLKTIKLIHYPALKFVVSFFIRPV